MAAPKNYQPKKVNVIFANRLITGMSTDGIEISYNNDLVTLTVGLYGDAGRAINNDRSARITLNLNDFADDNAILSEAMNADRLLGTGSYPFTVKDLNGTTLLKASNCWVVSAPAVGFTNEQGSYTWTLETDNLEMFVGGRNEI